MSPTSACCSPAPTPTVPKHQGITWFAFDMHQPGVEVRPLREMTGNTMFSEVFFTDAVVRDDARIGAVNNGWTVANTTLFHERSGMGARGGGHARSMAREPGTVAGDLERRAGDFARRRDRDAASIGDEAAPVARRDVHRARTASSARTPIPSSGRGSRRRTSSASSHA